MEPLPHKWDYVLLFMLSMGIIGYCFTNEPDMQSRQMISYFYKFIPHNGHNYQYNRTTNEYVRQMLRHQGMRPLS